MPSMFGLLDCPESALGSLDAADSFPQFPVESQNSDKSINGVTIPQNVIDQLRRLGVALSWYTPGELQAAVNSCAVDCTLIDDPDGINFMDDLSLTEDKIEADAGEISEPWRASEKHIKNPELTANPFYPSFRDQARNDNKPDQHKAIKNEDDDAHSIGAHA